MTNSTKKLRIGANPIIWSNDDLQSLGGETPLETCLSEARQAGFEGMELGHKFPRTAPALRAVLEKHELALVSGWYSAGLLQRSAKEEIEEMRPHLELLRELGAEVLVFAETTGAIHGDRSTPLSRRPRLSSIAEWHLLGERMTEVGQAIADAGLALVYHHHMGTVVESEEDIARLMENTGEAVKLLLDTGHATFAGIDPIHLARRYKDRIAHVHTKDVRAALMTQSRAEDWSFLDSVVRGTFTVPGDGMVDFAAVLAELRDYRGWIVIEAEQEPAKANPLHYARLGRANLARLIEEAEMPA